MAFHKDIALTPVKDGLFQTEIIEDYWIIVGPNGGYLGALLTSAGDIHVGKDSHQLRGLTIHYLSPPKLGTTQVSVETCLLYTSPSPRDISGSRMPSSA